MNSSNRNGSHGVQIKTTPAVTRLRKLSLEEQPIISELTELKTSRKEGHQSLSSLPTSSRLSPRPDRRNLHHPSSPKVLRHPSSPKGLQHPSSPKGLQHPSSPKGLRHLSPKGSPQFQRHFGDLDIRNPKICPQSKLADGPNNRRQNALGSHGNGDQGNNDVLPSARKTSRSNSLPYDGLSVDALIDQWTSKGSNSPNVVPRLPPGSEHFEAVMDEMTTTPARKEDGQGPDDDDRVTKTVRISPMVQVTIGSPRLQPKKRNK